MRGFILLEEDGFETRYEFDKGHGHKQTGEVMKKSTTIWMKKKYGKKRFVCKIDPVKGYCFHVIIFGSGLIDPKPTDWFESIQVAKREGWQKVPR